MLNDQVALGYSKQKTYRPILPSEADFSGGTADGAVSGMRDVPGLKVFVFFDDSMMLPFASRAFLSHPVSSDLASLKRGKMCASVL